MLQMKSEALKPSIPMLVIYSAGGTLQKLGRFGTKIHLDKLVYVLLATSKSHFIRREKTNLYQSKEKSPSICMFEAQSMKAKEILAESIV